MPINILKKYIFIYSNKTGRSHHRHWCLWCYSYYICNWFY